VARQFGNDTLSLSAIVSPEKSDSLDLQRKL
jgi:hypothetical protein